MAGYLGLGDRCTNGALFSEPILIIPSQAKPKKKLEKRVLRSEGYLFEYADTDGFETRITRRIWANL